MRELTRLKGVWGGLVLRQREQNVQTTGRGDNLTLKSWTVARSHRSLEATVRDLDLILRAREVLVGISLSINFY